MLVSGRVKKTCKILQNPKHHGVVPQNPPPSDLPFASPRARSSVPKATIRFFRFNLTIWWRFTSPAPWLKKKRTWRRMSRRGWVLGVGLELLVGFVVFSCLVALGGGVIFFQKCPKMRMEYGQGFLDGFFGHNYSFTIVQICRIIHSGWIVRIVQGKNQLQDKWVLSCDDSCGHYYWKRDNPIYI